MVSVGVSRMGKTNMIFIDPGAKVLFVAFLIRPGNGSVA